MALVGMILLFTAPPLAGQALEDYDYEDLQLRGIGVEAGRIWPARVEAANFFGLRADLGFIGPRVRILPSARFWSSSMNDSEVNRLASQIVEVCKRQSGVECPERLDLGEVNLSDLELTLDAHYLFLADRVISPYLGLSAGLHLLNGHGDFIDNTFVEDLLDSVAPGLGPILGANIHIGSSIQIGAEARMMLASDVRYASFGATGVWTLPTPRLEPLASIGRGRPR